jgi:hypothetical protein
MNTDELTEERRKGIEQSIHPVTVEELKTLGEGLFPFLDHPWRERYFAFLAENPGAVYHHATSHDGVNFIYCLEKDKGLWFTPGSGMGPLQAKGCAILKQIVEAGK